MVTGGAHARRRAKAKKPGTTGRRLGGISLLFVSFPFAWRSLRSFPSAGLGALCPSGGRVVRGGCLAPTPCHVDALGSDTPRLRLLIMGVLSSCRLMLTRRPSLITLPNHDLVARSTEKEECALHLEGLHRGAKIINVVDGLPRLFADVVKSAEAAEEGITELRGREIRLRQGCVHNVSGSVVHDVVLDRCRGCGLMGDQGDGGEEEAGGWAATCEGLTHKG